MSHAYEFGMSEEEERGVRGERSQRDKWTEVSPRLLDT
jgi:hypothetical protein